MSGVTLRVRVLGGLAVDGVDVARLGSRKARQLVACLALGRGAPVPVDGLVEVLWAEDPPGSPHDQLSVLVSRARAALGTDRVLRLGGGYALLADWLDLTALGELATEARRRLDVGAAAPARAAAQAALDLYRGPLLPAEPPDADWLAADRAALARTLAEVRRIAAEAALAAGDSWAAVDAAATALAAEPYDEAALRVLMRAHAASGQPALALRAFAEMADRLGDELGIDPDAETQAVHVAVLRGEMVHSRQSIVEVVGRSAELSALTAAYAAGTATLVSVEGESGIGKSHLLDAWAAALPAAAIVLRGAGDELAGGLPLQPVFDALSAHLRRVEPSRAEALLAGDTALLAPLVGGAHGAGPTSLSALTGQAAVGATLLFAALDAVVARLVESGPVVILLDDAHWADRSTVAWLHHVVRRLATVPLLVVAARWPEEGAPIRASVTIPLGPLDLDACAALIGAGRAAELYARSGGNPLFLTELARAEDVDAPDAVRAAVRERCDRAGAAAPTLLAAAALGAEVDLDLLAGVLGRPPAELLDHLEEGVRRHLLVERGSGFAFAHELLREALRASTSANRAAYLHRAAAHTLAGRRRGDALALAYHARLGGDTALAADALARAADIAASRYDHEEALRLLDEAVGLDDEPALLVRRARVRLLAGEVAGAARDAAAATAAGAGPEALEVAAIAAYHQRDFARAAQLADEGVARAEAGSPLASSCLAVAGRVRHATGDLAGARQLLADAAASAPAALRPVIEVWRAQVAVHASEPARAIDLLSVPELVGVRRDVGYPFAVPHRHLAEGVALAMSGRPAEALAAFSAMADAAQRQHTERFAGREANYRAWIVRNLGAFPEADDANRQAHAEALAAGVVEPTAHALLDLADGRLRAGAPDEAADLLARAGAAGTGYAFEWRATLRGQLLAGRWSLSTGDAQAAVEAFSRVRDEAATSGVPRYVVAADVLLGCARRALGEPIEPESIADAVLALGRVAPLESWWLTAQAADAFGVAAWRAVAADRVARLAEYAGPYAEPLRRAAATVLAG